jgi:hypothetical protein
MINQTLMIAIGFTCVATILLFLYFKRKITSIEYKLDSLFTLIEQHTQEKNRVENSHIQQNMMTEEQQVNIGDESKIINLIPVSDNEIETDSEEEFTTEEESEEESEGDVGKQENVGESGFEEIHLENLNKEDVLEELGEDEETNVTKLDEYERLEIVDDDKTNILGVDILNYSGDLEELEELESDFEESDGIDLEGSSKKVIELEVNEELQKELQYVNLEKLKVPTLREIADKYNLHKNSKKLKKDELIQLLQKHK